MPAAKPKRSKKGAKGKGKKGKKRKKKDPNAPKRPLSAFMLFANKNRQRIIQEQGLDKRKIGLLGKAIGAAWAELNKSERATYNAMATKDKQRYDREKEAYLKANPIIKKPISAYMFYVQENRPKLRASNPNATFNELGKSLGKGWHALSAAQRKPYTDKAAADKIRFQNEVAKHGGKNSSQSVKV